MKSGNRDFLEPSGPLQTCNGTALPVPLLWKKNTCTRIYYNSTFRFEKNEILRKIFETPRHIIKNFERAHYQKIKTKLLMNMQMMPCYEIKL